MPDDEDPRLIALKLLEDLLMDQSSGTFHDFGAVSNEMLKGYSKLVSIGLPPNSIAMAMLGATVNLYRMFDMTNELPATLRALADQLDAKSKPS